MSETGRRLGPELCDGTPDSRPSEAPAAAAGAVYCVRLRSHSPSDRSGSCSAGRSLSGSLIGGIAETQEMLDFCGVRDIASDVEVIPIQKVNEAFDRLLKADVKYRFSIDRVSLRAG